MSIVRPKLTPKELAEALKQKLLAKLDLILSEELPRAGTHGIKLTLDIAPLEKQDYDIVLSRKV